MAAVLDGASAAQDSRARRLKAATSTVHEKLDQRIMAAKPFADRERYGCFLRLQHRFHRDVDALYGDAVLGEMLPDLSGRRRLPLIEADLADLGLGIETAGAPRFDAGDLDRTAGLGWLYVAEGSNLGAAFLFKAALKLGLDETFGARHLTAAPEGRAPHWRAFTTALNRLVLSEPEEARVVEGAEDAFRTVRAYVEDVLG